MISGVILAGGKGERFGGPKQVVPLLGVPLIFWSYRVLSAHCDEMVVVSHPDTLTDIKGLFPGAKVVPGGETRTESGRRGVEASRGEFVLIHDAARPLVSHSLVRRVKEALLGGAPAVVPAIPVSDTLRKVEGSALGSLVPREGVVRVQTPQGFRREVILKAHRAAKAFYTDDASLVEAALGIRARWVMGDPKNIKITFPEDLALVERLAGERLVGLGWDAHPIVPGRDMLLGGVVVQKGLGFGGHSDGDLLTHAVVDGLLGAAGLGDIGTHFPDSSPELRGISSLELLRRTVALLAERGMLPLRVDAVVVLAAPKLAPHIREIRENLARAMGIPPGSVSVKAKTGNSLGFAGEGRGGEAWALCTVLAPSFEP